MQSIRPQKNCKSFVASRLLFTQSVSFLWSWHVRPGISAARTIGNCQNVLVAGQIHFSFFQLIAAERASQPSYTLRFVLRLLHVVEILELLWVN